MPQIDVIAGQRSPLDHHSVTYTFEDINLYQYYKQWICLWGSFHVLIICYCLNIKCPQVLTLKVSFPTCGTILWQCRNIRRQGLSWGVRLPGTGLWWYGLPGPFFIVLLSACCTVTWIVLLYPTLCQSLQLSVTSLLCHSGMTTLRPKNHEPEQITLPFKVFSAISVTKK